MADGKPELLPTNVVPSHYDLHITPNFTDFTFAGQVKISVDVKEATTTVQLHSLDIKIKDVCAVLADASVVKTAPKGPIQISGSKATVHPCDGVLSFTEDVATIHFATALPVGACVLDISYEGELNNKMCGFYRAKTEIKGKETYMAVTQHEPTDCRRTLPCFDEPALKATFTVALSVDKALTALSNMPVSGETEGEAGLKKVAFEKTPKMSTYLLAMVVGELGYVEGTSANGVLYRVYTLPEVTAQGEFALEVGMKVLDFFSDYFASPYPLPKMDMVAIPDFSAGAMENWGLVTYRETALLIDQVNSPLQSKQRVAYVVAHELAHQWFGNLVTMEWWTDLWLNEGFATWVGNFAIDYFYKDWDIWTQFVNQYTNRALALDSLETSHPIEVVVKKSSEVNEIFDEISYCKGAACIMMITSYLGMEKFQEGIRAYLQKHKYGNARTVDLWAALSEVSGKDVGEFMGVWTKEVGYPVLTIEEEGASKLKMTQARFLSNGKQVASGKWWWVPVTIQDSKGHKMFVDLKTESEEASSLKMIGWVKGNAGQTAFYRIKYSDKLLTKLGDAVEQLALPAVDRLGVQSDAFALARAGLLETDKALGLAAKYANENDFTVWADLAASLSDVMGVWAGEDEEYAGLQRLLLKTMANIMGVVGWDAKEGEHPLYPMLRPLVIGALGRNGDASVVDEARKRLAAGYETVPADLRFAVYSIVVAGGGAAEFDTILKVMNDAAMAEEKIRALRALGFTKDPTLIARLLKMSTDGSVRAQDVFYVFGTLASNRCGAEQSWTYIQTEWKAIIEMFSSGQFLLARILKSATSCFSTDEKAAEVEAFFKDKDTPGAERSISQALETIRGNAAWLKRDGLAVKAWLAANT